ncbi:class I SAM-dependent methyltransferase [uncultured Chryseobacterium sp.]|uniref:class I SAM-dependent methyltransferase n=3 Tax=uncultured Chryseobacterium sp. TaxID=259322 RepID=UPI0025DB7D9B|nr:class I SAM-dependent methyltransferase [uncultured Chryseobacterium sp.]
MENNYQRFSLKVQDYIKFRPDYPEQMLEKLEEQLNLDNGKIIADIGSGTGLSSKPFLEHHYTVYAVEPNDEMRKAAEVMYKDHENFISVNGTSENTTLEDSSVDVIFSAQAFHWFDLPKTKIEFERILKPGGHIILVWNERDASSPLLNDYEKALYDNISEYKFVNHKNIDEEKIKAFFSPKKIGYMELDHQQWFDLEGFKGRARSSSYTPGSGALYDKIMHELEQIFNRYQTSGLVDFRYKTKIYFC